MIKITKKVYDIAGGQIIEFMSIDKPNNFWKTLFYANCMDFKPCKKQIPYY